MKVYIKQPAHQDYLSLSLMKTWIARGVFFSSILWIYSELIPEDLGGKMLGSYSLFITFSHFMSLKNYIYFSSVHPFFNLFCIFLFSNFVMTSFVDVLHPLVNDNYPFKTYW